MNLSLACITRMARANVPDRVGRLYRRSRDWYGRRADHPRFDPARHARVIQNGPAPKLSGWTTS
jgi:hypothetical protein